MKLTKISLLVGGLLLTLTGAASADDFVPLPALDNKASTLKIKFVRYTGGVNGAMIVDVKNAGKRAQTFTADSLYFVPTGDPELAPQRLGAAGPFRAKVGAKWIERESTTVAPGQVVRAHLQVFCIDSHRGSPEAGQGFTVARKRLPKELRTSIGADTKKILRANKGSMKKSKSAIQSKVWENRNKKWIKLQGERKVEKAPHSNMQIQQQRNRIHRNRIKRPLRNDPL